MWKIEKNAWVVLEYTLHDADAGEMLDASDHGGEPIVYVHGYGMIVPGLETALVGMKEGDQKEVVLTPEQAFGRREPELVAEVDRSELPDPERVIPGDELVAESTEGHEAVLRVVEVRPTTVVVDGNHPLAGKTLRYAVRVRQVRPATAAEIVQATGEPLAGTRTFD